MTHFFELPEQQVKVFQQDQQSVDARLVTISEKGIFLSSEGWYCYRRNYVQITARCVIDDANGPYFLDIDGQRPTISGFAVGVQVYSYETDAEVELVQMTVKRDAGPKRVPPVIPIIPNVATKEGIAKFFILWHRL